MRLKKYLTHTAKKLIKLKGKNLNILKCSASILLISSALVGDTTLMPKKIIKKVLHQKTQGELIEPNSPQARGDWQGYYHGVLPCDTCKGVDTWVRLKKRDNRGEYEMREKFLGVKNRYSVGGLGWQEHGKIASLMSYNNRKLMLNKKSVNFLDKPYAKLSKIDAFKDDNSVLLVDPKSVLKGRMNGKSVVGFDGMINFDMPTENGYKSSKAKYVIHCKNKKYELSHASYYKGRYGMRGFIRVDSNVSRGLFSVVESPLVTQAYKRYCKR